MQFCLKVQHKTAVKSQCAILVELLDVTSYCETSQTQIHNGGELWVNWVEPLNDEIILNQMFANSKIYKAGWIRNWRLEKSPKTF